MNSIERYDYLEEMAEDILDAIRDSYTSDEIRARLDQDRDSFTQSLLEDFWADDSITGNASGSYYCNSWNAEEAIAHNWDLIADAMESEYITADTLRQGPETIDVCIRCYLLPEAVEIALSTLDDVIPEAADETAEE